MSKAALVCAVMGPEKAREDLLSYLVGKKEEMDQVLLALSKSLAHFFPYIGGQDHCHLLIPLFEKLLNTEETVVRSAGK
jgi:serine/threonine-protein phosphatase 2A regulatory subunit A